LRSIYFDFFPHLGSPQKIDLIFTKMARHRFYLSNANHGALRQSARIHAQFAGEDPFVDIFLTLFCYEHFQKIGFGQKNYKFFHLMLRSGPNGSPQSGHQMRTNMRQYMPVSTVRTASAYLVRRFYGELFFHVGGQKNEIYTFFT